MYLLIFLALCVSLIIPTYGMSLLIFLLVKNWFDNKAMSALLGASVTALREGISEERYHINRSAIYKVFSRFSEAPPEVYKPSKEITFYWGILQHSMINNGSPFSVRFAYSTRAGTRNTVSIMAVSGIDPDTLKIDYIPPLMTDKQYGVFIYPGRGGDDSIREIIVKSARSDISRCDCPNIRYGRFDSFVEDYSNGAEWFENSSGLRFWIDIDEFEYVVYVKILDASNEDRSGVSISARMEGPVSLRS